MKCVLKTLFEYLVQNHRLINSLHWVNSTLPVTTSKQLSLGKESPAEKQNVSCNYLVNSQNCWSSTSLIKHAVEVLFHLHIAACSSFHLGASQLCASFLWVDSTSVPSLSSSDVRVERLNVRVGVSSSLPTDRAYRRTTKAVSAHSI